MATISAALAIALQHQQAGRLDVAEDIYRRILAVEPNQPDAWHLLGLVAHQVGKHEVAVEHIRRAIVLHGAEPAFHNNLGEVFRALQRLPEAIACYETAVNLDPNYAKARHNLGVVFQDLGRLDQALTCLNQARELGLDSAESRYNLGVAFQDRGRLDEAVACYQCALELKPYFAECHANLGNAFRDQSKPEEAVACYRRALELKPAFSECHSNLGNALKDQGKLDEAIACYRRALELKPDLAGTHSNLGNALKDQGKLDDAVACYRRAMECMPDFIGAHSSLVYALQFRAGEDAQAIYEESRRWDARHAEPLARDVAPHTNDRTADRRLRVGYVSPNFWSHVVGLNLLPLLRQHDHEQFQVICYADALRSDNVTEQFRACSDIWRDVSDLSDEQLARLIRQDQIDILVDLTMHMAHNRLLTFARKPTPVQVCWAAYPGTTGLTAMDYRLTDPHLDPPGQYDRHYAEQSIRLPDTFWCYNPLGDEPEVNAPPALANETITFGCLNNFCKVNAAVLSLWAQVLKAVDGARLMLMTAEGAHRAHTLDFLQQQGIAPHRVQFVTHQPRQQYLQLYHQIDLGLDTFPYNGHSTSLDSFWMGVPVVTLVGTTVVGRAGLSQLMNLGLPELIAAKPDDFVKIAVELAGDLSRLSALRAGLRERMRTSPLMDAPRFARSIEAAYRTMWRRWCDQGEPIA